MHKSGKPNFLIDGFPRNKDNVDGWKKAMDDKVNIQCVLFFDCNEQVSSLPKHLSSIRERAREFRRVSPDVWNEAKPVDEPMTMKKV